ncbi:uncharacterized protein LOC105213325 [Zeugodacus cucurbitae]|uniref:Cytochrome P450 2B1 n=2 Tax=Zeugodacus cucurbitae TaxID=28588 RepID=A0A0A1WJG8_ZEUCU|nr:uncharacterized protein LOC105213325 [Zeugodacus cucurbitae]
MAANFKSRTNAELNTKPHITVKGVGGGKMFKDKPKRHSKQKRSSRQVHISESLLGSHKSPKFDEDNILSTQSSVGKISNFSELIPLGTPYTKAINVYSRLLEIQRRKSSAVSSTSESSSSRSSSNASSVYNTSSLAFVLKRQQFCKGEYTNAKCGRYNRIHPPLCSIPAESLACVAISMENLTEKPRTANITVYQ